MNHGTKFCRLCLKLLLPTILTSSLPFYPYQKDERALPGCLLTRCSFSPLRYKAPLAFPQMFSLFFCSYTILSDSLSVRLQRVKSETSRMRTEPATSVTEGKVLGSFTSKCYKYGIMTVVLVHSRFYRTQMFVLLSSDSLWGKLVAFRQVSQAKFVNWDQKDATFIDLTRKISC
jgi:hypothetical protein